MTQAILAVLLTLSAWHGDIETSEARHERLATVAVAIDSVSAGNAEMAALLITQGKHESHFARHVHAGRCGLHPLSPPGECDGGLSVSPWQIRRGAWLPAERWESFRGLSLTATTRAARYAARALRAGLATCADPIAGAFSIAATGGSCHWPGARQRVRSYFAIASQLQIALAS